MIGTQILHYRIEAKLGEGGMGAVYLATDTKLDRKVAIKLLSSDRAKDPESRQRFIHEAKAEAMLSHPNIVTFHEVGEAEGQAFIVMEYVEGQTLPDYVQSQKLSVSQILDLVIQAGEGLQAAHEKSVIHRDIKPDNIMVTSKGHVKLTDFGLARWKGATKITKTGTLMGTVSYMSPEQAEGKKLDHRSDIFSLGVILYELLSGRRPFEGDSEAVVIYELMSTNPQPLARYARDLPEDLQRIVDKALNKDCSARYQSVADMLADLRGLKSVQRTRKPRKGVAMVAATAIVLATAGGYAAYSKYFAAGSEISSGPKRVVVLPFKNLGGDEQEYFADGIYQEVMSRLTEVRDVALVSRLGAGRYKNTEKPVRDIGEELGVEYVVDGTIRWQETSTGQRRLRMVVQLIRVTDDVSVWSRAYDTVMTEVFAVQSDIAQQVSENMGIVLRDPEKREVWRKWTSSEQAYDHYLRGRRYAWEYSGYYEKPLRLGLDQFQKAASIDSNFAAPYSQMSQIYSRLYFFQYDRSDSCRALARAMADRALALGSGHFALGEYHYRCDGDFEKALKQYDIAYQGNRSNSRYLWVTHHILRRQGKWTKAIANMTRVVQLEPKNTGAMFDLASDYYLTRHYEEAESLFNQVLALKPDHFWAYWYKSQIYVLWQGDVEKARAVIGQSIGKVDTAQWRQMDVWLSIREGKYEESIAKVTIPPYDSADYFLTRGEITRLSGQQDQMRAYYESATTILQRLAQSNEANALAYSKLGIAYAGLGRKQDAIKFGQKAVETLPISMDALDGYEPLANMALIYVMVKERDLALEQLRLMLSVPGHYSVPDLLLDPNFAALHDHPGFRELIEKYGAPRGI